MGRVGSSRGQIEFGSDHHYFFLSDLNPTRLHSGQKILIHTRPDRVTDRLDPIHVK
jgi:hypothetical protein